MICGELLAVICHYNFDFMFLIRNASLDLEGLAFLHNTMMIDVSGEVPLVTLLLPGEKHMTCV